jgi:hypothetical protein
MLVLNIRDDLDPTLKQILTDYRRVQVSRFPIIVEQHPDTNCSIRFVDSRFPIDTWRKDRLLAWVGVNGKDDKGRTNLVIYSRMVRNEKFGNASEGFHERQTADPKKMLGFLRKYVMPYSASELLGRLSPPIYHYDQWVDEPKNEYLGICRKIDHNVIAKEIRHLNSIGTQFRSDEFVELATRGMEVHQEAIRRRTTTQVMMLALVQPDQSVLLSWPKTKEVVTEGSRIYDSEEQLPENIRQQVAMLKLCEQGQYVPEVGTMKDPNTFWIQVNPNDFNFSNT